MTTLHYWQFDEGNTLCQGDEARVAQAVRDAEEAGVDAIWPEYDLVHAMPKYKSDDEYPLIEELRLLSYDGVIRLNGYLIQFGGGEVSG